MPNVKPEAEAAQRQLERVLGNKLFTRSEQLSRLLRFLVERHLEGRDREIKESVIGVEVFGRDPDYNPKFDPIVRTEARRLRTRLTEYVEREGRGDALVIELPKGTYVPVVRRAEAQLVGPTSVPEVALPRPGKWRPILLAGMGLGIVLAVFSFTLSHWRPRLMGKPDSAADDLYRRARAFEALPNVSGVESSIDLFDQAIIKVPWFGPAYAGIAAGYAARSGFDGFDTSQRADMLAKGWAAAERAIQLDPESADANEALGMMQAREAQWKPAERSFLRAIQLAPRDVLWRDQFAMFLLLPLGRLEEAIRQLRIAEEIEPLSPQTHSLLRVALVAAGRFDEALFHCQKAAQSDQQRSGCWADNLEHQGRSEEAVRILEPVWSGHLLEPGAQVLGVAYAKAGRRTDAESIAAMLPRLASKAQVWAALGNKDQTFHILGQMAPMGPARIGRDFLISPNFAFLAGDPRFAALRRKVGLPQ